ncbi:hypothetical protein BDM02DRAFT_3121349, partial [Thelephora ganbajun]
MKSVRPVQLFPFGGLAFLVQNNQVGRQANSVDHPAPELLWVVDVVVLRDSGGVVAQRGPRQNVQDGVCSIHQRLV